MLCTHSYQCLPDGRDIPDGLRALSLPRKLIQAQETNSLLVLSRCLFAVLGARVVGGQGKS